MIAVGWFLMPKTNGTTVGSKKRPHCTKKRLPPTLPIVEIFALARAQVAGARHGPIGQRSSRARSRHQFLSCCRPLVNSGRKVGYLGAGRHIVEGTDHVTLQAWVSPAGCHSYTRKLGCPVSVGRISFRSAECGVASGTGKPPLSLRVHTLGRFGTLQGPPGIRSRLATFFKRP